MAKSIRMENLHLARHLCDGLGNLAAALAPITNEAALIKMGQGKKAITDVMARDIEQMLGVPCGWMDRNNEGLIRLTALDHELFKQVSLLSDEAKKSLFEFISHSCRFEDRATKKVGRGGEG